MDQGWLWVVFTLIASSSQVVRNAMQRSLTSELGTVGATHVRFLFGFPFALIFLALLTFATGAKLPLPGQDFFPWLLLGALAQIFATALMLAAMGERSFVVTTAYIKTEAVQVALFGLIFLGDLVTIPIAAAILIATAGVLLMSIRPAQLSTGGYRPTVLGIVAGGLFALSAIGYRGAILTLDTNFVMAATFTLACGLFLQAALLTLYLALRDRKVLLAIFRSWKPSLFAGFMGAFGSQFWFLAFAVATAASVRTLALVEVLFAQAISTFVFHQKVTGREVMGMILVVAGVALLLWAH